MEWETRRNGIDNHKNRDSGELVTLQISVGWFSWDENAVRREEMLHPS